MSLDYVRAGEPVRSSTVNSLIGAVAGGGNQSPDFMVTGTPRGPQFSKQAETGSVGLDWGSVFDVRNYTLSGWPMAKIKLGFSLGDALKAVRIHGEDGVDNPVSAIVVAQNSANCPFAGGQLSTTVLGAADFAKDAARGATGWVKTGMEGAYGATEPRIEIWRTTSAAYEVFTNAEESAVEAQVSAAVAGGAGDQLSTLQKVDGWTLVRQSRMEGRPTSRVVMKNGVVDVWEAGAKKPERAMLKAFLGCYETTSGGAGRTSTWTWLVPMGDGADYDDSNEGAWSTQCSYGGDPVFVECGKGELDANYDGSARWLTESRWGTGLVAFGKFTSDDEGKIEPGKLWMDLAYDYNAWAVRGTLNDGSADPPQGEAVLITSVKVAECPPYKAKADAQKGDEVPPSQIFQGTLGDLFMGTPKLDSYTPVQSGVTYSSLNWTKRGVDQDGAKMGPVTCRCLQIKDFDAAEGVSAQASSDMWLVRRFDNQTSSAELVYVPVETEEAIPDSALSGAQTSSLQWRQISSASSDSEESSYTPKVLQAWNFDQISDVYNDLCIALSGQQQHVMLRNCETSAVEYVQLSCLSVLADSQGRSDQRSIGWLESDTAAPEELQLWNFDKAEAGSPTSSDMLLARRSTETGPELVYLPLQGGEVVPDSETSSAQTSSLQWRTEPETSSKVLQIWKFDAVDEAIGDLSAALSGESHVMLRNCETSSVQYLQLSALSSSPSCDSQYAGAEPSEKSIQWREIEPGRPGYLQLYWFEEDPRQADRVSVQLSVNAKPLLGPGYEFVVRKTSQNGDRQIEYKSLSAACLSGGTGGAGQLPGPFEMELSSGGAAKFTNCVMRIARAYFFFEDQTLQGLDGTDQIIYVKAEHADPPTIELSSGPYATVSQNLSDRWSNMLSVTVTPLYRVQAGEVKCDYRYMMNVQAYDAKNYHYGM